MTNCNILRLLFSGMDFFVSHFPSCSRVCPSRMRKFVLQVPVTGVLTPRTSIVLAHCLFHISAVLKAVSVVNVLHRSAYCCKSSSSPSSGGWSHALAAFFLVRASFSSLARLRIVSRTLFVYAEVWTQTSSCLSNENTVRPVRSFQRVFSSLSRRPCSASRSAFSLSGSPL